MILKVGPGLIANHKSDIASERVTHPVLRENETIFTFIRSARILDMINGN